MIQQILEALKLDLHSTTENIEIARGKYKLPMTINEALKPLKMIFKKL